MYNDVMELAQWSILNQRLSIPINRSAKSCTGVYWNYTKVIGYDAAVCFDEAMQCWILSLLYINIMNS